MRQTTTKSTKFSTSLRFINAQLRHICFADWSFARKVASAIGGTPISALFHSIGIRLTIRCFVFWIIHDLAVRSPVAVVLSVNETVFCTILLLLGLGLNLL